MSSGVGGRLPVSSNWLDDLLATFKRSFQASWAGGEDEPLSWPLLAGDEGACAGGNAWAHLQVDWTAPCVVDYAREIGAWRAVFDKLFFGSDTWKVRRSFDAGHVDLGWGCMFVGKKGHEPLVSRRWLEFGPWWLRKFPGDVSFVQFHDLDADAETAFAEAFPGHKRMSDHDVGGWLRWRYRPAADYDKTVPEFRAVYVRDDQSLRVVSAPGRVISQREMLDACAERLVAKYNPEQPARTLRYVFIDPADAEKHLHELWLRDIEVWAIENGKEVRLDDRYHPTPIAPAWVLNVQERANQ